MKVAIFNGSPMRNDATSKMTSSIAEKIRANGSDVKEYFLYFMNIKGCIDCGVNRPDDELKELIDEFVSSDITIFATPVYRWNISGALSTFIEELNAYCKFDEKLKGMVESRKIMLAMATESEENVADDAIASIRMFCDRLNIGYAGSFIIPFADRDAVLSTECQERVADLVKKILQRSQ
ncbi:MAG: flavodoxin family protein [Methanomassiliicoccaceae archaeon]|jgi:multimeric flavodoxin WrbA|nr:flavodoxin family protein [Methanomassiliicoccaceae archaeon]